MKKKILILDDKETIAKVLSIYLMSDYEVHLCSAVSATGRTTWNRIPAG